MQFFWRETKLFRAEKKLFCSTTFFAAHPFPPATKIRKVNSLRRGSLRGTQEEYIFFPAQVVWNAFSVSLLYLGVNWIGLYTKYLTERAQRKAFLETRRSLEMRFKTQKENERQERLLLSVLPSFVAQQMIRDIAMEEEKALGDFQPDQFHKIYIHRYEQVIY